MRSLGLPVTAGHVSVFNLFRMPLGAFQPNDQLDINLSFDVREQDNDLLFLEPDPVELRQAVGTQRGRVHERSPNWLGCLRDIGENPLRTAEEKEPGHK